uniref:Uncharacterized protein n=1 Tax=Rhizophora mucronata TaxID=61149 RepID=A0A2P2IN44_RHIMU
MVPQSLLSWRNQHRPFKTNWGVLIPWLHSFQLSSVFAFQLDFLVFCSATTSKISRERE